MANLFQQMLGGFLNPFQTQAATFLTGVTQSRAGTAGMGMAQGGQGSVPGYHPLGQTLGNAFGPVGQQLGNAFGAVGNSLGGFKLPTSAGQFGASLTGGPEYSNGSYYNPDTQSQQNPFTNNYYNPDTHSPVGHATNQFEGTQQISGMYGSLVGGMKKTWDEETKQFISVPITNAATTGGWNSAFGATNITDANGLPVASNFTSFQFDAMAAQAASLYGTSLADFQADLKSRGYTQFGSMWVYNPEGGYSAQNALLWWQKEGFESEKKANQYYTEKKRAEKKAAEAENPRKNGQFQKGGSYGITTATSTLGSG
jgi:hypothetical protein